MVLNKTAHDKSMKSKLKLTQLSVHSSIDFLFVFSSLFCLHFFFQYFSPIIRTTKADHPVKGRQPCPCPFLSLYCSQM